MKRPFAIVMLAATLIARAEDKPPVTHKPDEVVARVGDPDRPFAERNRGRPPAYADRL